VSRWAPRQAPATLDGYADFLRQRPPDTDPEQAATHAGTLAGLEEGPQVRLRPGPDEEIHHFAGYLAGHLLRWLVDRGRAFDDDTIATASFYAAPLGDEAAQSRLGAPAANAGFLHTYLMVYLEKKLGRPVDVEVESLLVSWLLTQLRVKVAADDVGRALGRSRARRLAGTFPEPVPETPDPD
jgi:hypothetical protein